MVLSTSNSTETAKGTIDSHKRNETFLDWDTVLEKKIGYEHKSKKIFEKRDRRNYFCTIMAGHSKWSNIKRRKETKDVQKAKVFTKVTREIIVATQQGGPILEQNARLRLAVQNAKSVNLPKDNILRAIKKGDGTNQNDQYQPVTYEGYASNGIALLIETLTDNTNRTVANIRALFTKHGGSLDKRGAIRHLFDYKSLFVIPTKPSEEEREELSLSLIEVDIDDIQEEEEHLYITAPPSAFQSLQEHLEKEEIPIVEAGMKYLPNNLITLPDDKAEKVHTLINAITALDDVQHLYHNLQE